MGQIAATVIDAVDIRSFDCLLPDDVQVSKLASRLAELFGFPTAGSDNSLLNYGLVIKRGKALDSQRTLHELNLQEPLEMRLIPEVIANQDEMDNTGTAEEEATPVHIEIRGENTLVDDANVNLRMDVRIDAKIHREIEKFASQDRYLEFAGLLLGSVDIEDNMRVIHIAAMIPAAKAIGNRSEIKITLDAWESMLRLRDEQYGDLRILGWFHSHTGWGVFASDSDVFIHRHFFSHRDMVAYVLDLISGRDGFFCWQGETIVLSPSFGLVVTQNEDVPYKQPKRNSRVPLLRNCVIALLLIGALLFGGAKLLTSNKAHRKPPHTTATVTPVVSTNRVEEEDRVYTIGKRDNLWKVCNEFYNDGELADELALYNGLTDYVGLQVGQEIKLPPQEVLEAMLDN